jgi:hypothetical protein
VRRLIDDGLGTVLNEGADMTGAPSAWLTGSTVASLSRRRPEIVAGDAIYMGLAAPH